MPKRSSSDDQDSLDMALQRTAFIFMGRDEPPRKIFQKEPPTPTTPTQGRTVTHRRQKVPKDLPRLRQKTLYGYLELSTVMDALNGSWEPYQSEVREVVDSLINSNPRQAVRIFNRHFGDETIHLRLRFWKLGDKFLITDDVPQQLISTALRKLLLSSDPIRMKKCHGCSMYFFDRTRPRNQRYCMPTCQSRETSRTHRRNEKIRDRRQRR
jgi:hypothetical protein